MTLETGKIIDRSYRIIEQLGAGGMGTVYRAVQLVNRQTVALKLITTRLLQPGAAEDPAAVEERLALAREFQTLASLHHPNIIRVLSYGFDDEVGSYYTMEILDASQSIVDAGYDMGEEGKVQLVAQLFRALAYIHRRGVLHRDIKPGNILTVAGEVKLLDFGIATEAGGAAGLAGTLEYMAPELLQGQPPSVQSDLYAAGMVFHQLMSGVLPGGNTSMTALLDGLLGEDSHRTLQADSADPTPQLPVSADLAPGFAATDLEPLASAPTSPSPGGEGDGASEPPADAAPVLAVPGPLGDIIGRLTSRAPEARPDSANTTLRDLSAAVPYALPIETAATRESFLQATLLIGRDSELSELRQALERTKQATGSAFLIGGESGVGKSRLLSELRTLALVHGSWVADGQSTTNGGYYYEEWLPFLRAICIRTDVRDDEAAVLKDLVSDLAELLGRPIPDAPVVKPEAAQARIISTLAGMLRRLSKPVVLILEDLHWARSESLGLLTQLQEHIPRLPILLIGTFRSDESPELPGRLPGLKLLPLSRLDAGSIARLSESMLGTVGQRPELVAYLSQQTEGNVFFLVEIVRALAENAGELQRIGQGELPETVLTVGIERIVERRLDRLPSSFRPWLDFAAVAGRRLDPLLLEGAFPGMPLRDFLIECANAAVVESQGSDWRFAHDKLRETLLRRMGADKLRSLHGLVAQTMEAAYTGSNRDSMSAVLAYHFKEAQIYDKALAYYELAGDCAVKLYIYEQARTHYAAAEALVALLPPSSDLQRRHVDILLKTVKAALLNVPPEENLERLARARVQIETLLGSSSAIREDRLRLARIDYYCARLHQYAGRPGEAIPYLRKVLPIAQEHGDQELLVMPSMTLGLGFVLFGQMGKGREMLEPVLESMERLMGKGIDALRVNMFYAIALASSGHYPLAQARIERMLTWAKEHNQAFYTSLFHMLWGLVSFVAGDWPQVLIANQPVFDLAAETKEPLLQYLALDTSACAESHLGLHAEALDKRARSVELRKAHGGGMANDWFSAGEAEIRLQAGRPAEALELARSLTSRSRAAGQQFSLALAERVCANALARLGAELSEIEAHLAASLEVAQATRQIIQAAQVELSWGQIYRQRHDVGAATPHFERAMDLLKEGAAAHLHQAALRIAQGATDS